MNLRILFSPLPFILIIPLILVPCSGSQPRAHSFKSCLEQSGIPRSRMIWRSERAQNEYDRFNYQWNKYYRQKMPLGYILPESAEEVQAAVACGRPHNVPIVPMSGRHSYTAYSFGSRKSAILDFRRMDQMVLDSAGRTVEVGPGILTGQLVKQLLEHGRFVPIGLCPSIGISFSLGGGYGDLLRTYGLTLDSLLELDVVNPTADLLTTNKRRNKDLFWALRGAGSTVSFGIVTRYKFRVREVPDKVIKGRKRWALSQFPAVFDAFQKYCQAKPPAFINFGMYIHQTSVLVTLDQVVGKGVGPNTNQVGSLLGSKFPPDGKTTVEMLDYKEYLDSVGVGGTVSGVLANVTSHHPNPGYYKSSSFYVRDLINETSIQRINELIQRVPEFIMFRWLADGGALTDGIRPTDTAFVHRGQNLYKVRTDYDAPVGRSQERENANVRWTREFFRLTEGIMHHTETYQNYIDDELKDYLKRYYGENLHRLRAIKQRFDPTNYFNTNAQSIPPLDQEG